MALKKFSIASSAKQGIGMLLVLLSVTACSQSILQPLPGYHGTRPDFEEVNSDRPGEKVDVTRHLEVNKFTIVEFGSPFCGSCAEVKGYLKKISMARKDIAVRCYDINRPDARMIDFDSPLARQYVHGGVPAFRIYGPTKRLIAEGREAHQQIDQLIRQEFFD